MYLFGRGLAGPQTSKREKQPATVEDIKKTRQGWRYLSDNVLALQA